jgi:hypothetical protein
MGLPFYQSGLHEVADYTVPGSFIGVPQNRCWELYQTRYFLLTSAYKEGVVIVPVRPVLEAIEARIDHLEVLD